MEKEKTATEQLSQILDETGYNYITPYGFKLLRENEMVTNQKQAKIMAQLVKDTCSAAFADGRVMQAYKDGFEQGQWFIDEEQDEPTRLVLNTVFKTTSLQC